MDRNAHLDLAAVARAVAPHLTGDWTYDPEYPRLLRGPRGLEILFSKSSAAPRGSVSGQLPPAAYRRLLHQHHRGLRIGVDLRRDPAAIAREIERRLLPVYEPALGDCAARLEELHRVETARLGLLQRLTPLVQGRDRVEALTDVEVELTLHLDEAEAIAVLELLAARRDSTRS